jgi:hypothetical protein
MPAVNSPIARDRGIEKIILKRTSILSSILASRKRSAHDGHATKCELFPEFG